MSEIIVCSAGEIVQQIQHGARSLWWHDGEMSGADVERALDTLGHSDRYGCKGRMDRPGTYTTGGDRPVWIRPLSGWLPLVSGQRPAPVALVELQQQLDTIASEVQRARLLPPGQALGSSGAVARAILLRHTGHVGASTPGWVRHLGRRAIHQGPMLALVGGAGYSVLSDRSQAFLHALRAPMGTRWRAVAGIVDGDLTGGDLDSAGPAAALSKLSPHLDRMMAAPDAAMPGLVEAEVDVLPLGYRCPTLPAETRWGPIYAEGHVRGVWTLRQLAEELEQGRIALRTIHAAIVAERMEPVYEPVYRVISRLEYKPLRKALYTRAWGSLTTGGSLTLTPLRPAPREGVDVFRSPHSSWWVARTERPFDDAEDASALCRPDHAALVAADNDRAVRGAIWRIEAAGHHVHGVLTDAIMHSGHQLGPGWNCEVEGRLRQYGTGLYWYGGSRSEPDSHQGDLLRWRAMGAARAGCLEAAEIAWSEGRDRGRVWNRNPADHSDAVSMAPVLSEGMWCEHFDRGLPL